MAISDDNIRVKVKLSKAEYKRVQKQADRQRMSASAYMSRLIVDGLEVDEVRTKFEDSIQ